MTGQSDHPKYSDPDAIDAINKHRMLENYGSGYDWNNLDKMEFYQQQLLIICTNADAKKANLDSKKAKGYQEMGIMPVEF